MEKNISRRRFLKNSAATSVSLIIGLNSKGILATNKTNTVINPFVRMDQEGFVTVIAKHFENGQGISTGLATLLAEEMDADWEKVKVEFAPANAEQYKHTFWGYQATGNSESIANSFMQYRAAGAMAKDLMIRAASKKWGVKTDEIDVQNGIMRVGTKKGSFGEFVTDAVNLTPSKNPKLKTPDQFKLIGNQDLSRKDNEAKTDGSAIYGMDVKIPGMVYASVVRSPRFGGTLKSFDVSKAKRVPGFIEAKVFPDKRGVIVYAKNTWSAFQTKKALLTKWDFSNAESRSTSDMVSDCQKLAENPEFEPRPFKTDDDNQSVKDLNHLEAEFFFPFLAHSPMEPLNCIIEPTKNGVRFYDGCQNPSGVQWASSYILGLQPQQIEVKTIYAGGSFGRRNSPAVKDLYQAEAAIAFALLGKKTPVKLVWDREDDIRGGYYRPMAFHKTKIGLDAKGKILRWDHRIATKSISKGTDFEKFLVHNGVDHFSVEGCVDTLYQLPNMSVGLSDFKSSIPVLWWRGVGHTHTAYAMESLLDMVAQRTGKDPIELRLDLLNSNDLKQQRMANVLKISRSRSGWNKGNKRGFAAHYSYKTFVAVVADVSATGKQVHIDKLHITVDCGVPVNPDVIRAQMEGGAGYGLGALLRNEITFAKGQVEQSNFDTYLPLRISDMPEIDVEIVMSNETPSGVGEPSVPPTGPAVANAIFAVTGKRILELPMTQSGFQFV